MNSQKKLKKSNKKSIAYICQHCKERQTEINVWHTCSLPSRVNANGCRYDYDRMFIDDNIEDKTCPNCDQPVSEKIVKLFRY